MCAMNDVMVHSPAESAWEIFCHGLHCCLECNYLLAHVWCNDGVEASVLSHLPSYHAEGVGRHQQQETFISASRSPPVVPMMYASPCLA